MTVYQARELIQTNYKNRPLNQSLVKFIARDILEGNFDKNTYIILDQFGNLKYGQHTISAIILANKDLDVNVLQDGEKLYDSTINKNSKYEKLYRVLY